MPSSALIAPKNICIPPVISFFLLSSIITPNAPGSRTIGIKLNIYITSFVMDYTTEFKGRVR
jgi:hypothetical protein